MSCKYLNCYAVVFLIVLLLFGCDALGADSWLVDSNEDWRNNELRSEGLKIDAGMVHHGPVTDRRAGWVTTAEWVDGKAYIYYDFPNDQDPHLIIDADLTDGVPGEDMGMVFKDPSDGSDVAVIHCLAGRSLKNPTMLWKVSLSR